MKDIKLMNSDEENIYKELNKNQENPKEIMIMMMIE